MTADKATHDWCSTCDLPAHVEETGHDPEYDRYVQTFRCPNGHEGYRVWFGPDGLKLRDLTIYRDDEATYFDTDVWHTDLTLLTAPHQYLWWRSIAGPENTRDGLTITDELLADVCISRAEFDEACEWFQHHGVATFDGEVMRFPNLVWDDIPEDVREAASRRPAMG